MPASRTGPAGYGVTVRTGAAAVGPGTTDRPGPDHRDAPGSEFGPDRIEDGGPDRTVITLTDVERTALDQLRTEELPLSRSNIARAVRSKGGSISTDRAGQIAVALRQYA
ncbi:hypothetical protein [Streptomyces harbinensis]|uniref:hypothetical protein n=1 Tax=Streptomyces harbinensis TaxID=1176198 RepID=UPI0034DEC597